MTSSWTLQNIDGANSYVTTLRAGVDMDTEILEMNPTFIEASVFIRNPDSNTVQFLGTNIPLDTAVMADFLQVFPDITVEEYSNGFRTAVTGISFLIPGGVTSDIKISILEQLR